MIPSVLYDIVKDEVINRNVLIAGNIVENTNPDYKYFIVYKPFDEPSYDSRYFILKYKETPTEYPHPNYPLYEAWLIEYILEKRPIEEIYTSVDNAEILANKKLQDSYLFYLSFSAAIKQMNDLELTTEELQAIDDMLVICAKIKNNRQLAITKKALILEGEEPDIDALWES